MWICRMQYVHVHTCTNTMYIYMYMYVYMDNVYGYDNYDDV